MSCSRTQHGGGRSRTPDLSLRSPRVGGGWSGVGWLKCGGVGMWGGVEGRRGVAVKCQVGKGMGWG